MRTSANFEGVRKLLLALDAQQRELDLLILAQPSGDARNLRTMHCDCPNRRRDKHINDKHGQMVAKWLLAGEPHGHYDSKGAWHGTGEPHLSERELYDGAYLDDAPEDRDANPDGVQDDC